MMNLFHIWCWLSAIPDVVVQKSEKRMQVLKNTKEAKKVA